MKFYRIFTLMGLLLVSSVGIAQNNLRWVNFTGQMPANAVYGGWEQNGARLAVCRCNYRGAWHPGKVVAGKCNIGYGGREYALSSFQVLTNPGGLNIKFAWIKGNRLPPNAVVGGVENGRKLYVGAAYYPMNSSSKPGRHPGKVFWSGSQYICNIGYGGKEIVNSDQIMVLVSEGKPRANTNTVQNRRPSGVNCNYLAGTWYWMNQTVIVLKPAGVVEDFEGKKVGKWLCPKSGTFQLVWNNGSRQDMNLDSRDYMTGRASNGASVSAKRMNQNDIKAYKQTREYADQIDDAMGEVKKFFKKK